MVEEIFEDCTEISASLDHLRSPRVAASGQWNVDSRNLLDEMYQGEDGSILVTFNGIRKSARAESALGRHNSKAAGDRLDELMEIVH